MSDGEGTEASSEAAAAAKRSTASRSGSTPDRVRSSLTEQDILALRQGIIEAGDDYPAQLEARRSLFYKLCLHDREDLAQVELNALIDEVQAQEGIAMAGRAALSDANALEARQDHRAAVMAYGTVLARFLDGETAAEALYRLGLCQLERSENVRRSRLLYTPGWFLINASDEE